MVAESIWNGDEQLNIMPLLMKFIDFTKKHAYFCCQRFTEFAEVILKIQSAVFREFCRKMPTPCTLNGTCSRAVNSIVFNSSWCRLAISSRIAVGRPKPWSILLSENYSPSVNLSNNSRKVWISLSSTRTRASSSSSSRILALHSSSARWRSASSCRSSWSCLAISSRSLCTTSLMSSAWRAADSVDATPKRHNNRFRSLQHLQHAVQRSSNFWGRNGSPGNIRRGRQLHEC